MLRQVYRLVSEQKFESAIVSDTAMRDQIIVRPNYLSICHADQRYFNFERESKIMDQKLPMALIHEGMGTVVLSKSKKFNVGDRVAIVPTITTKKDSAYGDNYDLDSKFMSSSTDGLMQEYVIAADKQFVKLTDNIPSEIAAFIEMMTVSCQTISRLNEVIKNKFGVVGIWGDGNVSYMTAAILKVIYPQIKVYVFGHHQSKLDYYSFVDKTYLTSEIPEDMKIDNAIEATGGNGSEYAIRQIIDYINPEGTIALLGVSENEVPINTRMVLQKGLKLIGSSRSSHKDFTDIVDLLSKNENLIDRMKILVNQIIDVDSVDAAVDAFIKDQTSSFGKTVMKWNL
ncbi:alcohol dehydrogenase catalytic domain-containing protein [Latilactobacillus curvatus]|uniref:alcohol dehydrogenase catalytic domain-containing protein n=1 Tax=Latilactobacillus curvatus TaxID=28038 RepID=UPI00240FA711|nr:alcohol dehydrogenase catalytic domain-containing protein [Latilactobacillus curvatus]MDG2982026.1 alcohol dehydrogenase catalytic domain-containing protein [Latilactobacillus curvatus]MDT3394789.1 alcohol dehydrogenase catalytic domain-containing protein [Bacillota bacterium]